MQETQSEAGSPEGHAAEAPLESPPALTRVEVVLSY